MKVLADGLLERDVSLRSFNTFGVDVNAASMHAFARLRIAPRVADRRVVGLPQLALGGGSNVLFTHDFDGCVLKIEISGVQRVDDGVHWVVQAGAGENWHALVERLIDDGVPAWKPGPDSRLGGCGTDPEHRCVRC